MPLIRSHDRLKNEDCNALLLVTAELLPRRSPALPNLVVEIVDSERSPRLRRSHPRKAADRIVADGQRSDSHGVPLASRREAAQGRTRHRQ